MCAHKTLTATEYGDSLHWVLIPQMCLIQNWMVLLIKRGEQVSLEQLRAWLAQAGSDQGVPDLEQDMPAWWTWVLKVNPNSEHKKQLGQRGKPVSGLQEETEEQTVGVLSLIYSFINKYLLNIHNVSGTVSV